jgi:hypothetical protein
MIPLALGWLLLLGTINVARDEDWNLPLVVAVGFVVMVSAYALLTAAIRTAQRHRDDAEEVRT